LSSTKITQADSKTSLILSTGVRFSVPPASICVIETSATFAASLTDAQAENGLSQFKLHWRHCFNSNIAMLPKVGKIVNFVDHIPFIQA
jgi:hypothetical protein